MHSASRVDTVTGSRFCDCHETEPQPFRPKIYPPLYAQRKGSNTQSGGLSPAFLPTLPPLLSLLSLPFRVPSFPPGGTVTFCLTFLF